MNKERVIATSGSLTELKSAGVLHLSLFGSVARGEAGPDSDVDLILTIRFSLFKTSLTLSSGPNALRRAATLALINDEEKIYALQYALEANVEAAIRLGGQAERLCPGI